MEQSTTECKFKVGDWVERIGEAYGNVVRGGIYKVTAIRDGGCDVVLNVSGDYGYDVRMFKHAKNHIVLEIIKDL